MINTAIEAAREAGSYLRNHLGNVQSIERKQGQSTNLVTELDKGSEKIIIGMIKDHYPSHTILAEESGLASSDSEYTWVIDPLDGTTNYAHGLPIFSVSIGVARHHRPIAGVVYDPMTDELFSAEKGSGAFLNGRKLHVSESSQLQDSLLVTGFPYNVAQNPAHAVEHFVNFLREAQGIRRLGSAAIDLAYVAAGRLDGFWEVHLNPWDKAAGMLLVEEAKGMVTDFSGNEGKIDEPTTLATNGHLHQAMLAVLKKSL